MSRSPPLRFVVLLLAGWTGIRAAWLAPGWWTPSAGAGGRVQVPASAGARTPTAPRRISPASPRPAAGPRFALSRPRESRSPAPASHRPAALPGLAWSLPPASASGRRGPVRSPSPEAAATPAATGTRWSLSAWSFLRDGDSVPLAAGGLLGGSQAGLRLSYRLNRDRARPLAVTARFTSPLRRPAGAEAALGLDWQPSRRVPVHLLGERRQRLGRNGRSAFALVVYGGFSDAPLGPLRVDAYAQAGMVGARSRDRFGDGALRLSLPLGGRVRLGLGAWAAAQPGVARLDLGPQVSLSLPLAGRRVTVAADWRQRLAGDARPDSGPALTLATDF